MNSQKHFCKIDRRYDRMKDTLNPDVLKRAKLSWQYFTNISDMYPLTKIYFRSTKSIVDERKKHSVKSWHLIHPFSSFNYYRQILMIFIYTTVWLYDVFKTTYLESNSYFKLHCIIGIPCNVVCLVDIFLNFNIGFISTVATIKMHYASGLYKLVETNVVLNQRKFFFFVIAYHSELRCMKVCEK